MIELGIHGHNLDSQIKIPVRLLNPLQGKVGIAPIEQGPGIIRIQRQRLIILNQRLIILLIMIKCKCFIIIICCFIIIKLDGFFESL